MKVPFAGGALALALAASPAAAQHEGHSGPAAPPAADPAHQDHGPPGPAAQAEPHAGPAMTGAHFVPPRLRARLCRRSERSDALPAAQDRVRG